MTPEEDDDDDERTGLAALDLGVEDDGIQPKSTTMLINNWPGQSHDRLKLRQGENAEMKMKRRG
ncbi:hypothetical protein N7472_010972 [Penicillium cf. griseofulvum]|uniref:Uncharacterized protein n=1 Tax=Penicillium cf. griseofulvum TaxID=2972120 RepID=A0A9W9IY88_9EURO|nr:hypothetical protein N7472_010972 [Penicillium cf. griseofulvum]